MNQHVNARGMCPFRKTRFRSPGSISPYFYIYTCPIISVSICTREAVYYRDFSSFLVGGRGYKRERARKRLSLANSTIIISIR